MRDIKHKIKIINCFRSQYVGGNESYRTILNNHIKCRQRKLNRKIALTKRKFNRLLEFHITRQIAFSEQ